MKISRFQPRVRPLDQFSSWVAMILHMIPHRDDAEGHKKTTVTFMCKET